MGYGLAAKAIAGLLVVLVLVTAIGAAKLAYSRAETAELAAKTEAAARISAEANLAKVEENEATTARLRREAEAKARTLDEQFQKAKEEIRALKNRKPVPKECADAVRSEFAPVAGVVRGMRDDDAANGGDPPPPAP